MFDLLIRGGEILDGTGAAGLSVAPGFIDIDTQSDVVLLVDGCADSQVCLGVTLEVIGGVATLRDGSGTEANPGRLPRRAA